MKNSISKFLSLAVFAAVALITSCSSDDDGTFDEVDPSASFVLNRDDFKGELNSGDEVILESGTYKLTGKLIVNDGAILIIKEGVKVEATTVSDATDFAAVRFIAVAKGGKIDVQGTATNPVVMTSSNKTPGAWGGLVVCGKAPINKGVTASAEVSDLEYGGTEPEDNSGTIKYLRLEYTGFAYNSDKEFNGLSLFGVGNGTTIEYVQSYEGSDDAFEWFGGTVNANYLVAFNSHTEVGDDLFDWTQGWTGNGENWYGKRTNAGNRGIEADNNSNNHLATPISNPTIKNITLVGIGETDTSSETQAVKLRVGTKATFDNVVLSNWKTGFDIQHTESIGYVVNGSLIATNVKFDNVTTKSTGKDTAGAAVDVSAFYTEDATATGAGNGAQKPTWANGWTLGL
ncbi:hypothetical protein BZARG_1215 [Bizionia argentinensis JUB59]|uniref:Multidrug transporter n=1 Tax=Bizionia argentinensis JUB59 TaxID=1046627 RepID=G2ECU6_9FLAO|nr:hypothetical protein [Bizionia argentinensis]EGV43778.1 hypothetical protein BZARG_1215 [Bizionia argentinensis JUB59]